jgi:uncharacterized membrane protein
MPNWVLFILQWTHVFFAIAWFGSSLTLHFLIAPATSRLPAEQQVAWYRSFGQSSGPLFAILGGLTVLLGILRGLAIGVLSVLGSSYGLTWIASLVLGIALAAWGARMTGRAAQRLMDATPQSLGAAVAHITRVGRIEVSGFFVILTLMIAMRFGY